MNLYGVTPPDAVNRSSQLGRERERGRGSGVYWGELHLLRRGNAEKGKAVFQDNPHGAAEVEARCR